MFTVVSVSDGCLRNGRLIRQWLSTLSVWSGSVA